MSDHPKLKQAGITQAHLKMTGADAEDANKEEVIKKVLAIRAKELGILKDDVNEGDNIYHSCVTSFKHNKFGEGKVISGEHTLLEDGTVTHYDATFTDSDGKEFIVRNIPVKNMHECVIVEHGHPKKKKKVKEEETVEDWFQGQTDVTLNGDEFYETFGWIGENEENIEEAEVEILDDK